MSIANYLTALDAQRDQLARNLTAMGVQASVDFLVTEQFLL